METINGLKEISKSLRQDIISMLYQAGSGHPGSSLSCIDIITCIYYNVLNLNLDENGNRIDKFILSKGHGAPAYYAVLASKGFIPKKDLITLRKIDSYLEGHPSIKINGVDTSSGSLGQGLSIANGMALAKKLDSKQGYIFCLAGDGEMEEGQIWEALMSANKYDLSNLILIVDNNNLQIDGTIMDVKSVDNLDKKIENFGFYVQNIDGHNFSEIINSINNAKESNKPSAIIAKTIKGKGVSFMENDVAWHGRTISKAEYDVAMLELK